MGGAAGHLSHLYENLNLTGSEIIEIISALIDERLPAYEKIDGLNLFFTYDQDTGHILCARNLSEISLGGLSFEDFQEKFKNHPAEKTFVDGFRVIDGCIRTISEATLQYIFAAFPGCTRWINVEIVSSNNRNIIPYAGNYIVFHDMLEINQDGIVRSADLSFAFNSLVENIDSYVKIIKGSPWQVKGPQKIFLKGFVGSGVISVLEAQLKSAFGAFNLSLDEKLSKYVHCRLDRDIIDFPIPSWKKVSLIKKILGDKTITLQQIKSGMAKELQDEITRLGSASAIKNIINQAIHPIEKIICSCGSQILTGIKSNLISDRDSQIMQIRHLANSSISSIQRATDPAGYDRRQLMNKHLSLLGSIDSLDVGLEGIVFEYPVNSKCMYKITGLFAPLNQICGLKKYGRGKIPAVPEEDVSDVVRDYVKFIITLD